MLGQKMPDELFRAMHSHNSAPRFRYRGADAPFLSSLGGQVIKA